MKSGRLAYKGFFCSILSCVVRLIVIIAFDAYLEAQPGSITLDNRSIFITKERPAVAFPHGRHAQATESCLACHHRYVNGKNVLKQEELATGDKSIRCSHCHDKKHIDGRHGLMDAFHLQCSGCHRSTSRQGKKSGPLMCGQCHNQ
jgi:hypothetical protein